ncbi:hypothetical protein [Microbacterium sp. NPDC087665]|uniref:hypothetical protein n=1 Tax=Microbacterium sp. NPDC087665 TaxID=3364194 RepID=UPI00381F5E7E
MRVRNLRDLARSTTVFAWEASPGPVRIWRALMWPALFAFGAIYMARGELHLTADRNGTFAFYHRTGRAALLLVVWFLVGLVSAMVPYALLLLYAPVIALLSEIIVGGWIAMSLVGFVVLALSPGTDFVLSDVGRETPRGDRWSFDASAQVPGTSSGLVDAILERIAMLPAGSIVAGMASDELRQELLTRGGFTAGGGLRLYRVLGPTGPEDTEMMSEGRLSGS